MTNGRLGHILIEDDSQNLLGILSDGDLRRAMMREDFNLEATVDNFMTKEPHTIRDLEILAYDLLKVIRDKKIQLLVVVDSRNRVVGAVHIHDLIEAGVES